MADSTKIAKVLFKAEYDEKSVAGVIKDTTAMESRLTALQKHFADSGRAAVQSGQAIRSALGQENQALAQQQQAIFKLNQEERERARLIQQEIELEKRLRSEQAQQQHRALGGVQRGASAVANVLSAVPGTGPATEALRVGADISDLAKDLPELSRGIQSVASSIPIVSSAASALTPIMGATAASVTGLAIAALPIAAVVGGIALVFGELDRQSREAIAAEQARTQAVKDRVGIEREVSGFLKEGDVLGAKKRLEQLTAEQEDANAVLTDLYVRKSALQAELDQQGLFQSKATIDAFNDVDKQIADIYGAGFELRTQEMSAIQQSLPAIQARNDALTAEADATAAAEKAEKDLVTAREQSVNEIEQINQRIASLDEQAANIREGAFRQSLEREADNRLKAEREYEDYVESVAASDTRLAKTRQDGLKRLDAIQAESLKQGTGIASKLKEALISLETDTNTKAAKENAAYYQQSLREQKDFLKQRRRAEQDAADSIFDAELNNDILALGKAQRQRDREATRAQQDFSDQQSLERQQKEQRLADLEEEQRQRREQLEKQAQEERSALQAQTAERIEAEKVALAERLKAEADSQDEADRQREKRLRRQAQDEEIAEQRRHAGIERQLSDLDRKERAEQNALSKAQQALDVLNFKAGQFLSTALSGGSTGRMMGSGGSTLNTATGALNSVISGLQGIFNPSSSGTARTTIGRTITAFDDGGIMRAGASGLFYKGRTPYDELVMPLTAQSIRNVGGAGGSGINIDLRGAHFSEGVQPQQVADAIYRAFAAQNRGIQAARQGY